MQNQEVFDLVSDDMMALDEVYRDHLNSDVDFIRTVGEYITDCGGKRLRPMLLLLVAKLLGYGGKRHIPLASVVELIHTATLLHDDVVDNAELRRGSASVNAVWGNNASVLVGDYLIAKVFEICVADGDERVLQVLSSVTTRMAEGEVMQLAHYGNPDLSEADYMSAITNKTALLFSAACRFGAVVGGVSREKEDALASFGLNLGIAFQLTDDCLDYASSDEELGKAVGNDLKEGKVTLPLIEACRKGNDEDRDAIWRALDADDLGAGELKAVLSFIDKHGGIDYTLDKARVHIEMAKESLELFEPNVERAALTALADNVIERTS